MGYQIVIDSSYKAKIEQLIEEYEFSSVKEFTECMVVYFIDNGINPRNKEKSLKGDIGEVNKSVSEVRKTMVGFIREQEKSKLNPILLKLDDLFHCVAKFMEITVSKGEIKQIVDSINYQHRLNKETDETNYRNLKRRSKGHFQDFIKTFKKGAFGGYTIDSDTYKKYVIIFDNLE